MQSYTSISQQEMSQKRNNNTQKRRAAIWVSLGALVIIIPLVLVCSVIVFFKHKAKTCLGLPFMKRM